MSRAAKAYKLGAAVMGILPEPIARHGGHLAGSMAWLWADERKRLAIRAMARVRGESPDTPSDEARAMAKVLFAEYGRYWAETFWIRRRRIPVIERYMEIEGIEHYRQAVEAGSGVITAVPHLGNWEIGARLAALESTPLLAVAENLGDEELEEWFVDVRAQMGIDIVLADGSSAVVSRLAGALAANGVIALLSDRDISGKGAEVEFFGERTRLPTGAVALSLRTGAALLPAAAYAKRKRGHRVVVKPPLELPTRNIGDGVQALAYALEDLIREAPTQWHMVSPNWPSDRAPRR